MATIMTNSKIEFRKDHNYCFYNGVEITPEKQEEMFGVKDEILVYGTLDTILIGDTVYSNLHFGELALLILGGYHTTKAEEYDQVLSQGHGFSQHVFEISMERKYVAESNAAELLGSIKKVKGLNKLGIDYPNIDLSGYLKFQDALENYYNKVINGITI